MSRPPRNMSRTRGQAPGFFFTGKKFEVITLSSVTKVWMPLHSSTGIYFLSFLQQVNKNWIFILEKKMSGRQYSFAHLGIMNISMSCGLISAPLFFQAFVTESIFSISAKNSRSSQRITFNRNVKLTRFTKHHSDFWLYPEQRGAGNWPETGGKWDILASS